MQFVDCDRMGMLLAVEWDDGALVGVGFWHTTMCF
ncbi:hypothetical protein L681_02785 [Stenotrophomonas maltophilia MF89]|nr:hypothetical protein L681_02785 [Stenotrophomonas maltophilia MF89]